MGIQIGKNRPKKGPKNCTKSKIPQIGSGEGQEALTAKSNKKSVPTSLFNEQPSTHFTG